MRTETQSRSARRRYGKITEAAEYLGVTDRTIRQMIADGRLTGYRSGNRLVRVDFNEIDQAMTPFGGALTPEQIRQAASAKSQAQRRKSVVAERIAEMNGGA